MPTRKRSAQPRVVSTTPSTGCGLNQTLCATDAAGGGPVSLNGSAAVGTPLLQPVIAPCLSL